MTYENVAQNQNHPQDRKQDAAATQGCDSGHFVTTQQEANSHER